MRSTLAGVAIAASIISVAHADPDADVRTLQAKVAALDARVKSLEAINARYREALEFLEKAYLQQNAQGSARDATEPAEDAVFAVSVAEAVRANMIEGPRDAPVTIVWAFDLADPYGRRAYPMLEELMNMYAGKIRIIFRNELVHPQVATEAHLAGCAAANQGKFPEFLRAFFKDGFDAYVAKGDATRIDEPATLAIARSMHLDVPRFHADMDSDACKSRVQADMADLQTWHVNATPTYFINGSVIVGGLPKEVFVEKIEARLKAFTASKVPAAAYYEREIMGKGEKKFRSKKDPHP